MIYVRRMSEPNDCFHASSRCDIRGGDKANSAEQSEIDYIELYAAANTYKRGWVLST
jgi:hypothetical protein